MQEIQKLLDIGHIKPIQYLTQIVHIKKKNGQVLYYVDFCDLNKACYKDEFHVLIQTYWSTSLMGIRCFCLGNGFSCYNKIKMDPLDVEKTGFQTMMDNIYYTANAVWIKNASATYL